MQNPEAHTVVDSPAFTVLMHPREAPKSTVALERDPTRNTAPTLVDPIVAASLEAKARLPHAAPLIAPGRPSVPRVSKHEGRWLFFAAAGLSLLILGAIAIWSAFR
jgi:hypothetical protein